MRNKLSKILSFLLLIVVLANCKQQEKRQLVKDQLLGDWIEVNKGECDNFTDSLSFIDNSTFAIRIKTMDSKKAFRYDIDDNMLVLFYQNSQMSWVEASRYPFRFEKEKLIINRLYGEQNLPVVFKKIHN